MLASLTVSHRFREMWSGLFGPFESAYMPGHRFHPRFDRNLLVLLWPSQQTLDSALGSMESGLAAVFVLLSFVGLGHVFRQRSSRVISISIFPKTNRDMIAQQFISGFSQNDRPSRLQALQRMTLEGADKSDKDSWSNDVNEMQACFAMWIQRGISNSNPAGLHMNRADSQNDAQHESSKKCSKREIDFAKGCVESKSIEAKARIRTDWGISKSSALENWRTSHPQESHRRFVEGHVARRLNDVTQMFQARP